MDDLRQGVRPAGHAVLDCLDAHQAEWWDLYYSGSIQLKLAQARARNALYASNNPAKQRQYAVEAAARLIDAIAKLDLEIEADAAISKAKFYTSHPVNA